jgi:Tfp pilus assembly protein PilZ
MAVKLPVGIRLPDGSEETSITENVSKSGLCFACNLEMQIGDRVYVTVGAGAPGEERDIPARVMWRRPAKDKGRAFYGVKLEGGA